MNEFLTIKHIAERWNIAPRRVQKMYAERRVLSARKFGRDWAIPAEAERPKDDRITIGKYKNWRKIFKDSE